MKFPQAAFDVQQNSGLGQISVRKLVNNNPPDSPYSLTADDYGFFGWTIDPADLVAAATLTVSQTAYFSLLVVPNTVTVNRVSFVASTVQGALTNFNGVGIYSISSDLTTLTKVAASATQTWTGLTPNALTDAPLSAAYQLLPGYYFTAILGSTSGTAMSVYGVTAGNAGAVNFAKNNAPTAKKNFSIATQTALPTSVTMSGQTATAFTPFLALS